MATASVSPAVAAASDTLYVLVGGGIVWQRPSQVEETAPSVQDIFGQQAFAVECHCGEHACTHPVERVTPAKCCPNTRKIVRMQHVCHVVWQFNQFIVVATPYLRAIVVVLNKCIDHERSISLHPLQSQQRSAN